MSSLDGVFTLQPEEMWEKTTLEKIAGLIKVEALALLPKVGAILAREMAAWVNHCAAVQSDDYNTLLAYAEITSADTNAIKKMATHHIQEKMATRFAVLASKSPGKTLEPLSGILLVLHDQVQRMGDHHHAVYNQVFTRAVLQQEALMTDLENVRAEQLKQLQMMIYGAKSLNFKETKHVVAFVGAMMELGVNVDGVLGEEDGEESEGSSEY